jgi:F-type H+-transporting ATPase subunit b
MNLLILAAEAGVPHENGWLLPHVVEEALIAGAASLIVFALLWWKALPAARNALAARSDRIADELTTAETARTEAEGRLADVQSRVANADNERQRLLVEARQTADALKAQLIEKAERDAADIVARASADIDAAKAQATADLQSEVGRLALGAAEEIVMANLDGTAQGDLVESYINQVGASR